MINTKNNSQKSIFAFIFARGGSKGIYKKNIKELNGYPLIAYSIRSALENEYIDEVYVSTEDDEIAAISEEYGAKVPFKRPSELATDDSPEWLSWRHAMEYFSEKGMLPDIMISLPTTSPLRSNSDINQCLEKLVSDDCDGVITISKNKRHPMFNMIKMNKSGLVSLFTEGEEKVTRRQDAPTAYDITTVAYALNTDFLLNSDNIFQGKIRAVEIPEERSIDIDTEFDFQMTSNILEKNE